MVIKELKNNFFCIHRFSVLKISGKDCKSFLQNLITNDLNILEKKPFLRTIIANPTGRIHFDVFIKKSEQHYFIFHELKDKENLKRHFDFFHILESLEFEESEQDLFYLLFLRKINKEKLLAEVTIIFEDNYFTLLEIKNKKEFTKKLLSLKYQQISYQELDKLRPIYLLAKSGTDFGEKNLPQEAGFRSLISFNKGCFVGQEVMARLKYKGRVMRVLSQIISQKELKQGDKLIINQKQDLGKITSACDIPYENNFYALGYVKTSLLKKAQLIGNTTCSSNGALVKKITPLEKLDF